LVVDTQVKACSRETHSPSRASKTYGHNAFQIIHIHTTVDRAHTTQHRTHCGLWLQLQSWLMPQSPRRLRNDLKCVEWDVKLCSVLWLLDAFFTPKWPSLQFGHRSCSIFHFDLNAFSSSSKFAYGSPRPSYTIQSVPRSAATRRPFSTSFVQSGKGRCCVCCCSLCTQWNLQLASTLYLYISHAFADGTRMYHHHHRHVCFFLFFFSFFTFFFFWFFSSFSFSF